MAHQAWLMGDAIGRTLIRVYGTHRRLLEWMTAAQTKSGLSLSLGSAYRRMGGALLLAAAAGVLVALVRPGSWPVAAPFLCSGPSRRSSLAMGQPAPTRRPTAGAVGAGCEAPPLDRAPHVAVLRDVRRPRGYVPAARQLPGRPAPVLAHRTSPTNIGLYLGATVAARDLGWLGMLETVDRLEATLATMGRLERFRGHFYNWYDDRPSPAGAPLRVHRR